MAENLKNEIAKHPYVSVVANLLSSGGNPDSTLFDLQDELSQCQDVVKKLIDRYGESVKRTDEMMPQ